MLEFLARIEYSETSTQRRLSLTRDFLNVMKRIRISKVHQHIHFALASSSSRVSTSLCVKIKKGGERSGVILAAGEFIQSKAIEQIGWLEFLLLAWNEK